MTRARELLAEAGYPGGRGFPKFDIQYNTSENHKTIAELIERQWRTALSIDVRLRNQEWASHLASIRRLDYDVARAGWIGDYADPNTFLEMFETGNALNRTGWQNKEYDELMQRASTEPDPKTRLVLMHDAEAILMKELPIIPIFYRVSLNMVRPRVKGFYNNIQDVHPLDALWIDTSVKRAGQRRGGTP